MLSVYCVVIKRPHSSKSIKNIKETLLAINNQADYNDSVILIRSDFNRKWWPIHNVKDRCTYLTVDNPMGAIFHTG